MREIARHWRGNGAESTHYRGDVQHAPLPDKHTTNRKLAGKAYEQIGRVLIAIGLLAATACSRARAEQEPIAITHVSVIDVASGERRADNTVLISGNRITYVGPATSARIPSSDSVLRAQMADTTTLATERQVAQMRDQAKILRATYAPAKCRSVIATLARNHTWVTPTLVVYQPYAHAFDSASTRPELAKYVPGIVKGGWARRAGGMAAADSMVVRSYFSFDRTRALKDAGVKLLAGSDMPQAFVYPGFSLHDELELLVRSGLTPLEALRTATYNPADYLGALDSLGTVSEGKVADLVLLDADPLLDIRNTRRISAVIANGRLFDRAARAGLLSHVEKALKP